MSVRDRSVTASGDVDGESQTAYETVVPLRWSDIDILRHVNNVHFADYADEARHALTVQGVVDGGADLVHVDIEYLRPIPFGPDPLVVRTVVEGQRLVHEIIAADELRARVTQELGRAATLEPLEAAPVSRDVSIRRADINGGGIVRAAGWTGLVQEARVAVMSEGGERVVGPMVIARYGMDLDQRIVPGESVRVSSSVARVGTSSAVIASEVLAESGVGARATSTIVAFDPDREVSRPWTDRERALLESRIP